MKKACFSILLLIATPAVAKQHENPGNGNGSGGQNWQGAPGPVAGVGLPILAIGYGVYWLVKRRRK